MSPHASGLFAVGIYIVGVGIFAVATLLMRPPTPAQIVEQEFQQLRATGGAETAKFAPLYDYQHLIPVTP